MNTTSAPPSGSCESVRRRLRRAARFALLSLVGSFFSVTTTKAVIPEPDNIVYGTVAIDGRAIGPADYDVVVEARRTTNGPALASYQMGAEPRAGRFYSLRIPLESLTPTTDSDATLVGDVIYIVVTDFNGVRNAQGFTVGQRGTFTRIDIGTAEPDSDSDGLPDAWELTFLGTLNQDPSADSDGDGRSNLQEYLAGTNPNSADKILELTIAPAPSQVSVSFLALQAQGPGYEGLVRLYGLQYATNLAGGLWFDLPGYTNLLGNNTTITYQSPAPDPARFYRGKVWLQNQ